MKNRFERNATDEIVERIDRLQAAAQGQWGKMDVAQMMAHLLGGPRDGFWSDQSAAHVDRQADRIVRQTDLFE